MDQLWGYLTDPLLLRGLRTACLIAVASFALAVPLGLGIALMRRSRNRIVKAIPVPYLWIMRGTPLLLQLLFVFNVLPILGLRISPVECAIYTLALNESAFLAEIFRGGLGSVKQTQRDAAAALGMSRWHALRRVVLPQALRSIVPAMGNEAIVVIKNTSLASVITVADLTLASQQVAASSFEYAAVFGAAGVMYLAATTVVALGQSWLERKLDVDVKAAKLASRRGEVLPADDDEPAAPETPATAPSEPVPAAGAGGSLPISFESDAEPTGDGKSGWLSIRDASKRFGENEVLHDVSLELDQSSVAFLIGPSGSGKTTLLRTINRLETLDSGEITVGGRHIGYRRDGAGKLVPSRDVAAARVRARIGMVFQHFNLFEHLTVMENILEAPVRVLGRPADEARSEAQRLLAWGGLAGFDDRYPHQLSGGQQQRIAIIRALATHPRLLLFDEPTSALDPELVGEVLDLIRRLAAEGMTMVVVTHEIVAAREWADKVVFMDDGEIVEQGSPEHMFGTEADPRAQAFVRRIVARGSAAADGFGRATETTEQTSDSADRVSVPDSQR